MAKPNTQIIDQLAQQARAGDSKAFGRIVKMMMNQVTALTLRMTGDRQVALDLAQDSFVSAWQKLSQFRGDASFSSWLYRIATNRTLNYLKSASVRSEVPMGSESVDPSVATSATDPERDLRQSRLREGVLSFMATLPDQQRAVFELRFYQDRSFEEIATSMNKSLGTVKTHYRQAVIKLRRWAEEKGWRQ